MLVQGAVDESVEAGAPAGPEKDPAGTEVADADMADAADEAEDGVTPQKRKTSPQDVVSYSCSPFCIALLTHVVLHVYVGTPGFVQLP